MHVTFLFAQHTNYKYQQESARKWEQNFPRTNAQMSSVKEGNVFFVIVGEAGDKVPRKIWQRQGYQEGMQPAVHD